MVTIVKSNENVVVDGELQIDYSNSFKKLKDTRNI